MKTFSAVRCNDVMYEKPRTIISSTPKKKRQPCATATLSVDNCLKKWNNGVRVPTTISMPVHHGTD